MDIAGAEEEIMRWKVAAQQEAAAGKAVEQEFMAQVCSIVHTEAFYLYIQVILL